MNVEQAVGSVRLRMKRESGLIGIVVDLFLDRFGLGWLSHHLSLFLFLDYTL